MRVIGYAADASVYCIEHAEERYPNCYRDDVPDREGNIVYPLFDDADDRALMSDQGCDDCFGHLWTKQQVRQRH